MYNSTALNEIITGGRLTNQCLTWSTCGTAKERKNQTDLKIQPIERVFMCFLDAMLIMNCMQLHWAGKSHLEHKLQYQTTLHAETAME